MKMKIQMLKRTVLPIVGLLVSGIAQAATDHVTSAQVLTMIAPNGGSVLKTPPLSNAVSMSLGHQSNHSSLIPGATLSNAAMHGAGNGGDGLELTPPADGGGDVVVPVPAGMDQAGTLEVDGTPGAGQTNELDVSYCKSDASGTPLKWGCEDVKAYSLNQSIPLTVGTYRINYSHTIVFAQVKESQKTTLMLKKLQVSQASLPIQFKVLVDLTDPSMQDMVLKVWFTDSTAEQVYNQVCEGSTADVTGCPVLATNDYREQKNIEFNPDGTFSEWEFSGFTTYLHSFEKPVYFVVVDPVAGDFVSVFPGVYTIQFTNPQTGQVQKQSGIKVE
jgi:hypothetical protein